MNLKGKKSGHFVCDVTTEMEAVEAFSWFNKKQFLDHTVAAHFYGMVLRLIPKGLSYSLSFSPPPNSVGVFNTFT